MVPPLRVTAGEPPNAAPVAVIRSEYNVQSGTLRAACFVHMFGVVNGLTGPGSATRIAQSVFAGTGFFFAFVQRSRAGLPTCIGAAIRAATSIANELRESLRVLSVDSNLLGA